MVTVIPTKDGQRLSYALDPADLAVIAKAAQPGRITVTWKGHTDIGQLESFFQQAVKQVISKNVYFRAWFSTDEGAKSFNYTSGSSVPKRLIDDAAYVLFECLNRKPLSDEDPGNPQFYVFANLDENATGLDDLQECVGVWLHSDDLPKIQDAMAEVVASTDSQFFPPGHAYQKRKVLEKLKSINQDLLSLKK